MDAPEEALRLDQQLCFVLYAASRALTRAYAPLLEPLGLTYPQYLVLLALWEGGGGSVKGLGERLHLDSGTLTPLLKRLERQGWVTRRREPSDERVLRVELTEAGRSLREQARSIPAQIGCAAGFSLEDPAEVARLVALREAVREVLGALEGEEG